MAKSLRSKEYDRIIQQIRRLRKQGYTFDEDIRLKKMSYDELRQVTTENINKHAYKTNPATKNLETYDEIQEREGKKRAKQQSYESNEIPELTEQYYRGWLDFWNGYNLTKARGAVFILSRTEQLVSQVGVEKFVEVLQQCEQDGMLLTKTTAYDIQAATSLMNGIQNMLWNDTNATSDEIKKEQEEITRMNDQDDGEYRFYGGGKEY